MTFLLRHWLPLTLLVVALFLGVRGCAEANAKSAAEKRAVAAEAEANLHRAQRVALEDSLALARAEASQRDTVYLAAVDTFMAWDTVWRTLPDTASPERVRAVADSAITHCTNALHACAMARAAQADVVMGLEAVNASLRGENASLRTANDALRDASEPASILPTIALFLGGCGIGYTLDGLSGAAIGCGTGLALDIGYRGTRDLLESLP